MEPRVLVTLHQSSSQGDAAFPRASALEASARQVHPSMRLSRRLASSLVFVAPLLLTLACGSDRGATDEPGDALGDGRTVDEPRCLDADGDGFGVDCADGPDCDDADDTVFEDCSACSKPDEGCPCAAGDEPVMCELDPVQVPKETVLCKDGMRYCRDGAWTGCMGVATFVD